jgi:SAM-dependent methyltransferase
LNPLRIVYRRILPAVVRHWIRQTLSEIPIRLRDLPADLRERVMRERNPLPPARLRKRVAISSSRTEFLSVGERCRTDILAELARNGINLADYRRWLDFGCGAGRVARHLANDVSSLTGIDIDEAAILWDRRNLSGQYFVCAPMPPAHFPDSSFDVIYAVSVFTHFDEPQAFAWLAEIRRLLRSGGLLIATTQPETLTYNRPDMSTEDHERLRDHGFVFRAGFGSFNDDTAFHAPDYLRREWSRYLDPVTFTRGGLANYLDLSIWRKSA